MQYRKQSPRRRHGHVFAGLLIHWILLGATLEAQTLDWGINGAGGSGTWDLQTANWYTGSENVTWPEGGNAIFGGANGGTVTVSTSALPPTSSMTFNTPGYVVEGRWIVGSNSGLTVTTNVDATINTVITKPKDDNFVLAKEGPAALQVGASLFADTVQVNQGELHFTRFGGLSFGNLVLADAPGVIVTIDEFIGVDSLTGGGPAGGVVRPSDQAGTARLTIFRDGSFGGRLEDHGSGVLALTALDDLTLTNANTHSGVTSIIRELALAGHGSALNSPMVTFGTLVLDNRGIALANRISDSLPLELNNGSIRLEGNATTPVDEIVGELGISGAASVFVNRPGSAAANLVFTSIQRNRNATLSVNGPDVFVAGLASDFTGIVPPYITAGREWATVGGDGRIAPLASYAADINTAAISDHVKLSGGSTILAGDATRASLNLQNGTASEQTLDLDGRKLGLTSGGILSSGPGPSSILGGNLTTPSQELVITAHNDLTIGSAIVDDGTATTLTKSGPGVLTLQGTNTYSGPTVIVQGTLVAGADAHLGSGSSILTDSDGTLRAAGSFSSAKTLSPIAAGTIDTAGFDVAFAGLDSSTSLTKRGPGKLTIAGDSAGGVDVLEGVLELANAVSGDVSLGNGTLQAAGRLSSLRASPDSILDIGGPVAATLTTDQLLADGTIQINFGIGSGESDFWAISDARGTSPDRLTLQFAFDNLGGVIPGVDYPLISFEELSGAPSLDYFAFAPVSLAAGWSGEFTATREGVSVRFTSVPEPSVTALLLLQGVVLAFAGRRLLRKTKMRR